MNEELKAELQKAIDDRELYFELKPEMAAELFIAKESAIPLLNAAGITHSILPFLPDVHVVHKGSFVETVGSAEIADAMFENAPIQSATYTIDMSKKSGGPVR